MKNKMTSNAGAQVVSEKSETPEIPFGPPPRNLELLQGTTHVFCAALDHEEACLNRWAHTLSDEERHRANHLSFQVHRNRFIAGRGILREVLGWFLHAEPSRLVFAYGPHGKPRLGLPIGGRLLEFNLAHSGGLAVYAVTANEPVGIDVEQIRKVHEAGLILSRFFSRREHQDWSALPDRKKMTGFFQYWTRKESLLKAIGIGLGGPLQMLECLPTGDPARQPAEPAAAAAPFSNYYLHSVVPARGYYAATAVKSPEAPFYWQWLPH